MSSVALIGLQFASSPNYSLEPNGAAKDEAAYNQDYFLFEPYATIPEKVIIKGTVSEVSDRCGQPREPDGLVRPAVCENSFIVVDDKKIFTGSPIPEEEGGFDKHILDLELSLIHI